MVRRKKSLTPTEKVIFHRVETGLGSVNLMHARFVTQTFAPHFHEGYCLGVIEKGALGFRYMGEKLVAPAGAVNLAIPGEVHTGRAAEEVGWTYRMFYLDADLLAKAASQMSGTKMPLPFIREGVLFDPGLAGMIHRLHRCMQNPQVPILEKETGLIAVLSCVIRQYSRPRIPGWPSGHDPDVIKLARDFIQDHYHRDISVRELASIAGLSPYHFIRVFHKQAGLTPHAYLTQVRVQRAMQCLQNGETPADTALKTGFFDQSHLTRHFKRIVGVTPGRYRNSVQDFAAG